MRLLDEVNVLLLTLLGGLGCAFLWAASWLELTSGHLAMGACDALLGAVMARSSLSGILYLRGRLRN